MVAGLWRCRWGRLCLGGGSGGVCGAAGVPGAGGPGRCVCPWAAARPLTVRAASFARRVVSKPGQASPPPTGTAAGPSGALHTCGLGVLMVRSARRLEAPPCPPVLPAPFMPVGPGVLSFWGALVCVVTNVVNLRAFSLKIVVFWLRLTTFVTEVLVRRFESRWFDDVCNVGRPPVARPSLAAAHGCRSLAPTPTLGAVSGSRSLAL